MVGLKGPAFSRPTEEAGKFGPRWRVHVATLFTEQGEQRIYALLNVDRACGGPYWPSAIKALASPASLAWLAQLPAGTLCLVTGETLPVKGGQEVVDYLLGMSSHAVKAACLGLAQPPPLPEAVAEGEF